MQNIKNDEEYAHLLSNFSFIDDNIIKKYYNEMNDHKWVIKNDNPNTLNVYLDYFNNNVNNILDRQTTQDIQTIHTIQTEQTQISNYSKRFHSCNHINTTIGKPSMIKKNDELIKRNEKCYICFHKFESGKFKRYLPNCKHFYHKKCIDKWLKINARCPICRDELI
jgi:hypothetical protein